MLAAAYVAGYDIVINFRGLFIRNSSGKLVDRRLSKNGKLNKYVILIRRVLSVLMKKFDSSKSAVGEFCIQQSVGDEL
jgi:hypothetical protein